ncbi:hypothetical protein LG819_003128 [Vibrio parahaemolyticus]|uniref:hypothetical protein n=1 Tax=Vibrio parahaemolyticus TaxID=670 RepID=UPI0004D58F36|nr:hypothetical protein [Vibrio parahaemolyticus]EGQ7893015.1 hypothetical protein [Vibrio parahaemolyticus]EGQ8480769.1 hypothetical protein [Vibrio parahaemolyticus]EGR1283925.1 hypothetical protein [Vibrio parahaemolyticus]EGR1790507.1 hypothetical protein [Vibrio parahaemolyticus]EGR1935203.1 hypothetical protein [Vibrio parahaemolyticus]
MKKKILLGLGLTTVVVAGVGYIATKSYFDEKARIGLLADWLDTNRGDTKSWLYRYDFKVPTNSKVANWNTENVKLPQLLFTVENPEDNSKVSYWAVNIDGTNPQLLIPDGVFPPPVYRSTTDYAKYMSRSPNGRYLVIPQRDSTVLYDLSNGEVTNISEENGSIRHDIMWDTDSTQVVVKKSDELLLVKLDTKEVVKFTDVNGSWAEYLTSFAKPYMSQSEQAIYLSFNPSLAGFGCKGRKEEYRETFGESDVPKCGNTFVFDAKTLKLVDRGDFTPISYDCNVWGGKYGDGFYCLGGEGGGKVYHSGRPSEKMGNFRATVDLLAFNGGDMWFVPAHGRNITRVLHQPTENSPTTEMIYTYRALRNGERVKQSAFGLGFSRYVIEHKNRDKWSESLYPLPSYADIEKARTVLEERNHG